MHFLAIFAPHPLVGDKPAPVSKSGVTFAVRFHRETRFPDSKADGEVAEWLKAHAWNACIRETVSRVRIPLSPPLSNCKLPAA